MVRAAFLYMALSKAHNQGDTQTVERLYARLQRDYADTDYLQWAIGEGIAPDRKIQKGKAVPDFRFASLDDSTVITPEKMKDQVYLIDFWGTWCGPCVGEMKWLHDAYNKYKSRGFTIISVAIDDTPQAIAKFRKSTWPMPWFNVLLEGGIDGPLAKSFEVAGMPKPILIGKDGQILAEEKELRGEELDKTLSRILGQ
jgi:thiol-disulfide isomerase/thioredoxin